MNVVPLLVPLGGLLLGLALCLPRWSRFLAIAGTVLFGVAFVLVLTEI